MTDRPADECQPGVLILEDGTTFTGAFVGAPGSRTGEAVFTTATTGYQQLASDPSFHEQIVCMTAPMVGNHGVDERLMESDAAQVAGMVMRCCSDSWAAWLRHRGIPALAGVDTRSLAVHLRTHGALRATIASAGSDAGELLAAARAQPPMVGRRLVDRVSVQQSVTVSAAGRVDVGVVDCGVRRSLLRALVAAGAAVTVHPHHVDAATLLGHDAVLLSSGPGDPASLPDEVAMVQEVLGRRPVLGVCLGHQLLALALGGRTSKMPMGHRGINHPVLERASGSVLVTSQNHGFEVLIDDERLVTHHSLHDGTLEGLASRELGARSVQFHPEAAPGPHDARGIVAQWVDEVARAS